MSAEIPVTFREKSYALFDVDNNGVCTTANGNLAIFSTLGIATAYALRTSKNIEVRPVWITPVGEPS
jgi:hypothetical protein